MEVNAMAVPERLRRLRQQAESRAQERERKQFEQELKRAQREGDGGRIARLKAAAQQAAKPARIEARGAVQEAKQLTAQNPRDVAAVVGSTAVSGARSAASSIDTAAGGGRQGGGDREQMFANAERAASAAAPVDATLDPVTSPQDLAAFAMGQSSQGPSRRAGPAVDQLVLPKRDSAGMGAFVVGESRGTGDPDMVSFVIGDSGESSDRVDEPTVDMLVPGMGGETRW
jgi:hypothetical protein